MKTKRSLIVMFAVVFIAACSTPGYEYKGVYEESKQVSGLDLPPGLSKPNSSESMILPELDTGTYSDYQQNNQIEKRVAVPKEYKGARFIRDGGVAWLEIKAPAEQVFIEARDFFVKLGFKIESESATLGMPMAQVEW